MERSENYRRGSDRLIGVVIAEKIVLFGRAAKAALAVSTRIAEKGSTSSEMFVVDLDEESGGSSSAHVTPS